MRFCWKVSRFLVPLCVEITASASPSHYAWNRGVVPRAAEHGLYCVAQTPDSPQGRSAKAAPAGREAASAFLRRIHLNLGFPDGPVAAGHGLAAALRDRGLDRLCQGAAGRGAAAEWAHQSVTRHRTHTPHAGTHKHTYARTRTLTHTRTHRKPTQLSWTSCAYASRLMNEAHSNPLPA